MKVKRPNDISMLLPWLSDLLFDCSLTESLNSGCSVAPHEKLTLNQGKYSVNTVKLIPVLHKLYLAKKKAENLHQYCISI